MDIQEAIHIAKNVMHSHGDVATTEEVAACRRCQANEMILAEAQFAQKWKRAAKKYYALFNALDKRIDSIVHQAVEAGMVWDIVTDPDGRYVPTPPRNKRAEETESLAKTLELNLRGSNDTIEELVAVLDKVEWIADETSTGYCPWCGGRKEKREADFFNLTHGHEPDCPRQKALGYT